MLIWMTYRELHLHSLIFPSMSDDITNKPTWACDTIKIKQYLVSCQLQELWPIEDRLFRWHKLIIFMKNDTAKEQLLAVFDQCKSSRKELA